MGIEFKTNTSRDQLQLENNDRDCRNSKLRDSNTEFLAIGFIILSYYMYFQ